MAAMQPSYHVMWSADATAIYAWRAHHVTPEAVQAGRIMTDRELKALSKRGVLVCKGRSLRSAIRRAFQLRAQ